MGIITALAPTTELEAVNTMRSAIGEAPVADLTSTATDVQMAVNLLRNATREVCSMGWRFNTEWGFELAPAASVLWKGRDGSTATLNQFLAPAGLAKFAVTPSIEQRNVDAVLRAAPPVVPVTDPLTSAVNTQFVNHVSPDGYLWSLLDGTDITHAVSSSLGTLFNGLATHYRFGAPAPGADYSVQVDAYAPVAGTGQIEMILRQPGGVAAVSGYVLAWGAGYLGINYVAPDGTSTQLFSGSSAVQALGSTHTIKFAISGYTLTASVDGVVLASVVDTAKLGAAAGYGGIGAWSNIRLSNWQLAAIPLAGSVFYDRARNRFGFESPLLYIDPVWYTAFEDMPDVARRYATVRAARQFAQQVAGSGELASFSDRDELYALRNLKREEGQEDSLNVFDNAETAAFMGYRAGYPEGQMDRRASTGTA